MTIGVLPTKVQKVADQIGSAPIMLPTVQTTDERVKKRRDWLGDFEFAVAPVITDGANILLVKGREDGKWTVPGGFVEVGEDADAAGVREAKEETGLTIEIVKPLLLFKGAIEAPLEGKLDYYLVIQQSKVTGGRLGPVDTGEISDTRFFSLNDLMSIVSQGPFRIAHPSLDSTIAPLLLRTVKTLL